MIGEYFQSVIWLLDVMMLMTETFHNSEKFSIIDLLVSFGVNHFAWEVSYYFPQIQEKFRLHRQILAIASLRL